MIGIYKIQNKITGDCYVGSSSDIESRVKNHFEALKKKTHGNFHLQKAWNKYGEEPFETIILEECVADVLLDREKHYIDLIWPEYNMSIYATGAGSRWMDEEYRKNFSEKVKKAMNNEITREKCRIAGKKNKGPFTKEHCKNISLARLRKFGHII